jgi:hypothetical protein
MLKVEECISLSPDDDDPLYSHQLGLAGARAGS